MYYCLQFDCLQTSLRTNKNFRNGITFAYKYYCLYILLPTVRLPTCILLSTSIIAFDYLQALLPTALLPICILFTIKYYFIFSPVSTRSDSHPISHPAKGRTTSIIVLLHMFSTREYYDSFL